MTVQTIKFEPPQSEFASIKAVVRVTTDSGVFAFVIQRSGQIGPAGYRFNHRWHTAFSLPPDDTRAIEDAIRQEIAIYGDVA